MTSLIVIIQCQIAHNRCSGFACSHSFYERTGRFVDYPQGLRYLSFTCGGCCGKSVAAKMEHLARKLREKTDVGVDDVVVHLASCMVTDNHHYDRCPHVDYIKAILAKKGFRNVVEGSFISRTSTELRHRGVYCDYVDGPSAEGR
ncbi:CGGC domain-containing protein [Aminithiophilus ramosus]|uniref:CGGC domain-containing protein n=1 Tax=Aminithiophilus ramosus TaxID=3029084 RepID=UPI002367A5F7|nr:CGGC domain-containing protein [Aminithiophilus ramosus]